MSHPNPFRPGAGHLPPYLSGRKSEVDEFSRLLKQEVILENMVVTGLRGLGKTVLLESLKPMAIEHNWLWAGTDLSEASSLTERNLAIRIITDLSIVTSNILIQREQIQELGFQGKQSEKKRYLNYEMLMSVYEDTPGLTADKLKAVLELASEFISFVQKRGVVFAYDEAQNLADQSSSGEYPLSLLLDVFQSLQRKNIPFMLVLSGLPTLYPKLVESRTYAERMFRVLPLERLDKPDTALAINKPLEQIERDELFTQKDIETITVNSGGYPYFIQFICREAFDVFEQHPDANINFMDEIVLKLDNDFFVARWSKLSDRQQDILRVFASLGDGEFECAVADIIKQSEDILDKGFSAPQANQLLSHLSDQGLVYKTRHGKYSFAIPLLGGFIKRRG